MFTPFCVRGKKKKICIPSYMVVKEKWWEETCRFDGGFCFFNGKKI